MLARNLQIRLVSAAIALRSYCIVCSTLAPSLGGCNIERTRSLDPLPLGGPTPPSPMTY